MHIGMMSNVSWKCSPLFLCVFILTTIFDIAQGSANGVLLNDLEHLNMNRHHVTNPRGKDQARAYIRDTLISLGLHTWTERFTTTTPMKSKRWTGINIVAVLPGRLYKTIHDRLILIGAHYDTMRDTEGVDDNASGVVAMLQVARLLTKKSSRCTREYSVVFVAFDFEEWEKISFPGCACAELGCGSRAFVSNFSRHFDLLPNMSVAPYGQLQGAIIMDTMMNYNSSPNSQDVPKELAQPFPKQYNDIIGNQKKGDFLLASGRNTDDIHLLNTFAYHHFMARRLDFNKYKLRVFPLPFDGNTSSIPRELQPTLDPFLRSDHVSFWNDVTSNRAIFLTDTASMRGYMRNCYHKDCDTLSHVTADFLGFLSKSCDIIVSTTNDLTMVKCQNKADAPHEGMTAEQGGLIGMGATLFAALNAVAAWVFCQRRKKDDENNLVVNDQLEDGKDDDVPSQSGTRELQDHPMPEA